MRLRYEVAGHPATPEVTVQPEGERWFASVLISDDGGTLHITRTYDTADGAIAAAEQFIRAAYDLAVITRSASP